MIEQGIGECPIKLEVGSVHIKTIGGVGSLNIGETYIIRLADTDPKKKEESVSPSAEPVTAEYKEGKK